MHAKSQVFSFFKQFYEMVETQFGRKLKVLRSDSEGEYTSREFAAFLAEHGVIHKKTCPNTPA